MWSVCLKLYIASKEVENGQRHFCLGDRRIPEIDKKIHIKVSAGIFSEEVWCSPGQNLVNDDREIMKEMGVTLLVIFKLGFLKVEGKVVVKNEIWRWVHWSTPVVTVPRETEAEAGGSRGLEASLVYKVCPGQLHRETLSWKRMRYKESGVHRWSYLQMRYGVLAAVKWSYICPGSGV